MAFKDMITPETTALGCRAESWEDAIALVGGLLEQAGDIRPEYTQSMIRMVRDLGPYIVMMPGIAVAHARPQGSVLHNSIAAATFPQGVRFGSPSNDPVYLVFAVAACTDNEHLDLFKDLAEFVDNEENISRFLHAATFADIGL